MISGWAFRNWHLLGKVGFCENTFRDSRTLLKGLSEFVCTGNLFVPAILLYRQFACLLKGAGAVPCAVSVPSAAEQL